MPCLRWHYDFARLLPSNLVLFVLQVWFDMDMMKGSTIDSMSAAVDGADVFLYAVSELCE